MKSKSIIAQLLYVLIAFMAVSCVADKSEPCPSGEPTRVSGSIVSLEHHSLRGASADKENSVERLELWVFDEDGHFLERSVADLSGSTFTAKIIPSEVERRIHFIANYELADPSVWVGRSEREMLPSISVADDLETIRMWARISYPSIAPNQNLGQIQLLRNMAKFSLSVTPPAESKLYDASYALYNSWNKGTLAPFDPNTGLFTQGQITEPAGVVFANPTSEAAFKEADGAHFFYGFERDQSNIGTGAGITCLILKARYNLPNADYTYYKLDFVDANKVRYNITRNHFYKMILKKAKAPGRPTLQEALDGAAANNIFLSAEVQALPAFSDGSGMLTVDHTYMVFVQGEPSGTFQATYIPQGQNNPDYSKLTVSVSTPTGQQAAVTSAQHEGNGKIKLTLAQQENLTKRSDVVIGVQGNPDLKRSVTVLVREKYQYVFFKANTSSAENNQVTTQISAGQGNELLISAKLPDVLNAALLPITFKVYTEHFYPKTGGMILGIEGGKTLYKYVLTTMPQNKELQFRFKSNKVNSAENIAVKMDYFHDQTIHVTN
ncbi:protein FimE [Porphyromonas gingivalis]|uniref:protein FimE n=1 Tax=Porphyromonas gingivalis TaxID=837 RepID=UPI001B8CBE99|nr:protein FimE [Porphyromonas gingivalis]QUI89456.1 protein FimE [Porphyromonas gingivalis]QUI91401.1 protein FimE [Porphyromonas gingivalis]